MNRIHRARNQHDKGFTLIELLVVIIIIATLAAIAIPVFLNQRTKGVEASVRSDIKSLAIAQETWRTDNPYAEGTVSPTALADAGFKASPGNTLRVAINITEGGYCIVGNNPESSSPTYPNLIIYDSKSGGFLNNGKIFDFSSFPPGAKSCGTNRGGWAVLPTG